MRPSFVLRPSIRQYLARVGTRRGVPLALAVIATNTLAVARQGRSVLAALLALEAVSLLAGVALGVRFFRRASVSFDGDNLVITGAWRRPRVISRDRIRGASARSIRRRQGGTNDVLILYGEDHHVIKVLNRLVWPDEDLLRLKKEFGRGGANLVSSPKTPLQLHAEFPGAVPSWDLHPWLTAAVLVFLGTAVLSALFLLADPTLFTR